MFLLQLLLQLRDLVQEALLRETSLAAHTLQLGLLGMEHRKVWSICNQTRFALVPLLLYGSNVLDRGYTMAPPRGHPDIFHLALCHVDVTLGQGTRA
jgi:hypothetical protein